MKETHRKIIKQKTNKPISLKEYRQGTVNLTVNFTMKMNGTHCELIPIDSKKVWPHRCRTIPTARELKLGIGAPVQCPRCRARQ